MNSAKICSISVSAVRAQGLDPQAAVFVPQSKYVFITTSADPPCNTNAEQEQKQDQEQTQQQVMSEELSKPERPNWRTLFPPALQYTTPSRLFAEFDSSYSSIRRSIVSSSSPPLSKLPHPTSVLDSEPLQRHPQQPHTQPATPLRPNAFDQLCKEIDYRIAFSNGRFRDRRVVYTRGAAWIVDEQGLKARNDICRNRSLSF